MKAWAGGDSSLWPAPPRPRCSLAEGAKPGLSDTRYTSHKNTNNDILLNFKKFTPKN